MRLILLLSGCVAQSTQLDLAQIDQATVADLASTSADLASTVADLASTVGDLAQAPYQLTTNFTGSDGQPWPAPWTILGGVASATLVGGRGRLIPATSGYSLGRVGVAASVRDVEVTFTLVLEDPTTQGVGFYVRQNGGWLANTATHGQGYAIFVEGFRGARMAMWHELDGQEQEISNSAATLTLAAGTLYAVRFQVTQESPSSTRLRARLWPAAQSEPAAWQIDISDGTVQLQNLAGGVATDSWSTATSGTLTVGTQMDDIVVTAL